ncbi:MAG: bifunctional nuclease family protein [Thermodesulfobacteriota bacterium]
MLIKMKVFGLTIDPFTNVPIVILKDEQEQQTLPVWIGVLEASAIASELEKVQFSRPMTHDLLKEILKTTKATVKKIEVTELKDSVYYATIYMEVRDEGVVKMDARPSDAIAIALRANAPIYVDSSVIEQSKNVDLAQGGKKGKGSKDFLETLEELSPGDFGKYKM